MPVGQYRFVDFPNLCRLRVRDLYLLHFFAMPGRRMVYSLGILFPATAAGTPLAAFDGLTDRLIPLFAGGALLSSSLSQAGMAMYWTRAQRKDVSTQKWPDYLLYTYCARQLQAALIHEAGPRVVVIDVRCSYRGAMSPHVYLAGPDVFFPDAEAWAERRKAICAQHGLVAVSPLDPLSEEAAGWEDLPEWHRIAWRNEGHIRGSDAVIANLTPFRGPSADVGTVYEVGFARALGRVVFGYTNSTAPFTQRTLDYASAHGGSIASPGRIWRDGDGLLIEQFQRFDNLMIEGGILGSGGALVVAESEPADRWRDLGTFETCVVAAAAILNSPPLRAGEVKARERRR